MNNHRMLYRLEQHRPRTPESGRYFVADNATVLGRVVLGEDVNIWFNAVLRGDVEDIVIGARSNVQDNCLVHADKGFPARVGEGVTVGHQATVHGCSIGDNSLIGIQAAVLNGASIGRNCIIGAHALIPEGKQIPDNSLVVGAPGRVKRAVTDKEINGIRLSSEHYINNFMRYKRSFEAVESPS